MWVVENFYGGEFDLNPRWNANVMDLLYRWENALNISKSKILVFGDMPVDCSEKEVLLMMSAVI